MKKVSIVLPTYNGEKYLEEAIDSVLHQTYQNWELIIVDDCSTDGTPEIIRRYAERDHRIHAIRNRENQKLPRSLNIGFRCASGDYFTWTSDDNFYDEDAIAVMTSFLEDNPQYGMVYCGMRYIDENRNLVSADVPNSPENIFVIDPVGACFLYRREEAEATGEYDADLTLVEDYDYWLRVSKHCRLYYLPEKRYTYRQHGGSLTQTRLPQVRGQLWRLRRRELDYLLAQMDEKEKWFLFLDMWVCRREETWKLRDKFFPAGELPQKIKWLEKRVTSKVFPDQDRPLILFGAGDYGRRALRHFGADRVLCFADNNPALAGKTVDGVKVISFEQLKKFDNPYQLVLCVGCRFLPEIVAQVEESGMTEYALFLEIMMNE